MDNKKSKYPKTVKVFSIVWVVVGIAYIGYIIGHDCITHNCQIFYNPNEIGDFLAGFFSPLAFLWLVLGYFQQQKELNINTQELKYQRLEMKESNRQFKKQIEILQNQYSDEHLASLPKLQFQKVRTLHLETNNTIVDLVIVNFVNLGATVSVQNSTLDGFTSLHIYSDLGKSVTNIENAFRGSIRFLHCKDPNDIIGSEISLVFLTRQGKKVEYLYEVIDTLHLNCVDRRVLD